MTRSLNHLSAALFVAVALSGGQALANVCQTDNLMCPTSMPVDGYCQCTAHGVTEDGTVVPPSPRVHFNATPGGCGADPRAPGCRGQTAFR